MIRFYRATKVFQGQYPALQDLDLQVEKGEFVFVAGPSGSGKSTLLRLAAGLTRPTSGQVILFGRNIGVQPERELREMRRQIGVVFQDFKLLYDRTVYENIAFALDVTGAPTRQRRNRIESVLGWVGLGHKSQTMPHHLSGGEQQRVAIARAVCMQPALLLADEPTGNLDEEMSEQILQLFEDLHAQGTTVLMATHASRILERGSRRIIRLRDGQMDQTMFG